MVVLQGCGTEPSILDRVHEAGELVVITRNSPTTYYEGPDGAAGVEYELLRQFAHHLDVRLELMIPARFEDILVLTARDVAQIAAAGLTVTDARRRTVRFGPGYQQITQQVVYRRGARRPRTVGDLVGKRIEVVAGSSHVERLTELKGSHPELQWEESPELESEDLLYRVWKQEIDCTIADSHIVAVNRRFFPELRVAFDLTAPESLAWAFPISEDSSLYDAAVEFFAELEQDGDLEQLLERYYGHVREFDYVDTRVYIRHIENRLPRYRSAFERAARQHEIDWRLLAAVGYQESHWNPKATSPTGVRGIMMLTRRTATHMSVANRLDPAESIGGAARYFRWVRSRIPLEVDEPDRTWLALAAYNVGTGHLEDARRLTDERGGDPDRWIDVRETLPLLSQTPWYTRTRYGYARGREPVRYVEAVRRYYDLLAWIEQGKRVENTRDVDRAALVEP